MRARTVRERVAGVCGERCWPKAPVVHPAHVSWVHGMDNWGFGFVGADVFGCRRSYVYRMCFGKVQGRGPQL